MRRSIGRSKIIHSYYSRLKLVADSESGGPSLSFKIELHLKTFTELESRGLWMVITELSWRIKKCTLNGNLNNLITANSCHAFYSPIWCLSLSSKGLKATNPSSPKNFKPLSKWHKPRNFALPEHALHVRAHIYRRS